MFCHKTAYALYVGKYACFISILPDKSDDKKINEPIHGKIVAKADSYAVCLAKSARMHSIVSICTFR